MLHWLIRRRPTTRILPRRKFRPRLEALEERYAPATLYVTSTADDNSAGTLRAVIAAADGGDTINFGNQVQNQTITLTQGQIAFSKPLTIDGTTQNVTISGNNASRIFNISANGVTFSDTISNLIFKNGNDGNGGAILDSDGILALSNDKFNNNTSSGDGGAVCYSGTQGSSLSITSDSFTSNTAHNHGGAVYGGGTNNVPFGVTSSIFTSNSASNNDGGAIYTTLHLTVTGGSFTSNTATNGGGGAIEFTPPGTGSSGLTLTNVTFTTNSALYGGGLDESFTVSQGSVTVSVSGCLFNTNHATGNTGSGGGGILVNPTTTNSASASFTISNSTFYNNSSSNSGGGLSLSESQSGSGSNTASLTSLTIYQNSAADFGGGLFIWSGARAPKFDNSIIAGNTVSGPAADGPDVYGTVNSLGYNLVGEGGLPNQPPRDGNTGWIASDYVGSDTNRMPAGLDPNGLADNGGPTETIKLLTTSQGYRNGDPGLKGTQDQRGYTRKTYVSIGAYDPDAS
jgi:predicted outer membrane repeat protein